MTIGSYLQTSRQALEKLGIDSAHLDSLLLLEYTTGRDRSWLLAHPEEALEPATLKQLQLLSKRRAAREPLAYILGTSWFFGLKLVITPAVLIPRPETEALVETILEIIPAPARVLEVGTGSGAIALALRHSRPSYRVLASDISKKALVVARQNAQMYGGDAIQFVQSDLLANVSGAYDVLVANLPYVATTQEVSPESRHEPTQALYGGEDGLDIYQRLFLQLAVYQPLIPQIVLEADPAQKLTLQDLAKAADYRLQSTVGYCYVFGRP